MIPEEEWVMISALQHFMFCQRQCALIHLEQEWDENLLTTRGKLEHERVDSDFTEKRKNLRQISGLRVSSAHLGIYGRLDLLELSLVDNAGVSNAARFGLTGYWNIFPVECKHGRSKESDCDRVQLCAQAFCLEEMLGCSVNTAYLFYRKTRKREEVFLNDELRQKTTSTISALRKMMKSGITPPPEHSGQCRACSLESKCYPRIFEKKQHSYRTRLFSPQSPK